MAEKVVTPTEAVETTAMDAASEVVQTRAAMSGKMLLGAVDNLWRLLRRPLPLMLLAGSLFGVLVAARLTPQMPGQLLDSSVETTRWVNTVAANWTGVGGALARALHLYDLFRAPWFATLVALMALLAAVQCADTIGRLVAWISLKRVYRQGNPGEPAALSSEAQARARFALAAEREEVAGKLKATLATRYRQIEETAMDAPAPAEQVTQSEAETATARVAEQRFLARRDGWSMWASLLLPAAALLGALLVWANLMWSWQVQTDTLAPGASTTLSGRDLAFVNQVANEDAPQSVLATLRGKEVRVPLDGAAVWSDGVRLTIERESPAIVVSADAALLALPEAPQPQESVGVNFPVAGTEQYVVLPGEGIGIRFVRMGEEEGDSYLAEVYDEAGVQPIATAQFSEADDLAVPLGDETLLLRVTPAWSVAVQAEHGFGAWMALPLFVLGLAGALALLRPATWLVAQVAPWEEAHAQVILQGNNRIDVAAVHAALVAQTQAEDAQEI